MTEPTSFNQWAIVEVFGHQRFAGQVCEETIGGCSFVRVDIPQTDGGPAFTKLFGQGAIYAMTIVSEEVARGMAYSLRKKPLDVYELPKDLQQRLPGMAHERQPWEADEDFDDDPE